jgi:hypothetical protein
VNGVQHTVNTVHSASEARHWWSKEETMFIRVIQGPATNPPGIRRDLGRWQRLLAVDADGWLGSTAGITEDGWSVTVVRFASEAQARRNSDRPEQREWWRDASQHLARVVVHDAPKVHRYRQGDADTAGFVQVIQGHSDDQKRMATLGRNQVEALVWEAPHILGMTVAEHADRPGDFTQIVYFTSEQDARQFEPEPPNAAEELAQEERRRLITNLRSFDLRDPQLLSPAAAYTY